MWKKHNIAGLAEMI